MTPKKGRIEGTVGSSNNSKTAGDRGQLNGVVVSKKQRHLVGGMLPHAPPATSGSFSRGFSETDEEKSRFKELRELEDYIKTGEIRNVGFYKKALLQARQEGREEAINELSKLWTRQYAFWYDRGSINEDEMNGIQMAIDKLKNRQ